MRLCQSWCPNTARLSWRATPSRRPLDVAWGPPYQHSSLPSDHRGSARIIQTHKREFKIAHIQLINIVIPLQVFDPPPPSRAHNSSSTSGPCRSTCLPYVSDVPQISVQNHSVWQTINILHENIRQAKSKSSGGWHVGTCDEIDNPQYLHEEASGPVLLVQVLKDLLL